jgi:N-acetylneuraminic acid mutarotase
MIISAALTAAPALDASAAGTWTLTGSMHFVRDGHTATLLSNGNVLAAAGEGSNGVIASSEIYNAATGTWAVTGNLNVARSAHEAVLLPSGKVLVAGGCVSQCLSGNTPTAELYNPSTGIWSKTGSMTTARVYFGMVLLTNGNVLAVGGCTGQNANGCTGVTSSSEIYNPSTGKWTGANMLHAARGSFTATLMSNGNVLVAGGINAAGNPINSVETYNPTSGLWALSAMMKVARDEHAATLLGNGEALVAGGENAASVSSNRAELYNATVKGWNLTGNMNVGRLEQTLLVLPNAHVLTSGGNRVTLNATIPLASAEVYDPATGVWTLTGSMHAARAGHTSTLLKSGLVLNAGGANNGGELASAELYQP